MKIMTVMTILLFSSFTQAKALAIKNANSNQSKFDIRKPISQFFNEYKEGIRAGLATGSLDVSSRARYADENQISKSSVDNDVAQSNYQLQIGYEEINLRKPGFSTFAIYQNMKMENENIRNMRIAGNATYGLTEQAYIFGGLNFAKYYGSGSVEKFYKAGIGHQGGVGLKINNRINLEVEYLTLLNEGRDSGVNYDVSAKGIMLRLNTPILF